MLLTRQRNSGMKREGSKAKRVDSQSAGSDGGQGAPDYRRVASHVRAHRGKPPSSAEERERAKRRMQLIRMLQEQFDLTREQAEDVVQELRASYRRLI